MCRGRSYVSARGEFSNAFDHGINEERQFHGERRFQEGARGGPPASIYVECFPIIGARDWLWRVFEPFGKIVDIFIPQRLSRAGFRFAFIRFASLDAALVAIDRMDGVWVGTLRLRAKHARERSMFTRGSQSGGSQHPPVCRRKEKDKFLRSSDPISVKKACLLEADEDKINLLNCCVIGKAKASYDLDWISNRLLVEGFSEFKISKLSGDVFLIGPASLPSPGDLLSSVQDKLSSWFSHFKNWTPDFTVTDRLAVLNILGLPLQFWSDVNMLKIAKLWGTFVSSDVSSVLPNDLSKCRLVIRTELFQSINEEILIDAYNREVVISIRESLDRPGDLLPIVSPDSPVFLVNGKPPMFFPFSDSNANSGTPPVIPKSPPAIISAAGSDCGLGRDFDPIQPALGDADLQNSRESCSSDIPDVDLGFSENHLAEAYGPEVPGPALGILGEAIPGWVIGDDSRNKVLAEDSVVPKVAALSLSKELSTASFSPREGDGLHIPISGSIGLKHGVTTQSIPVLGWDHPSKRKVKKRDIVDVENLCAPLLNPHHKSRILKQKKKKKEIIIRPISLESRGEDSLSDNHIRNNSNKWLKEAAKVWQLGKDIGIRVNNSDEEVVDYLSIICEEHEKNKL